MLGKMMKYEWKETWKTGLGVMFAMFAATLLGFLGLRGVQADGNWEEVYENSSLVFGMSMLKMASVFSIVLFAIVLVCATFYMLVYLIIRFYSTMYSSRGYLTHTLPVSKSCIFLSKVLVGGIWLIIVYLGVFASSLGIVLLIAGEEYNFADFLKMITEFGTAFNEILGMAGIQGYALYVATLFYMLLSPFLTLVIFFGSFTIGQLCRGARVFMGFVVYFAICLIQYILNFVMKAFMLVYAQQIAEEGAMSGIQWYVYFHAYGRLFVTILIAVGVYAWSIHILNKKLNLK